MRVKTFVVGRGRNSGRGRKGFKFTQRQEGFEIQAEAGRDGIVVPIKYESRKPEPRQIKEELEKLNNQYADSLDLIESDSELPGEVRKKFNKAIQQMRIIISDPDRIEKVSKDFIEHYEERKNILKGKAMFVALNRKIAFEYHKKIVELKPE